MIDAAALWSCTTCMHCVDVCPVGVEHVPTIVQLRRSLVDEGTMDASLQQALQNLATQGNSLGKSARMRGRWTRELDFVVPDARKQPVKYLWFVGDFASFDERLQENSRILARILHAAGVDFGLLYEAERNAGNDVRRVGEEGLFEVLAEHNLEALREAQLRRDLHDRPAHAQRAAQRVPRTGSELPGLALHRAAGPVVGGAARSASGLLGLRVTYHDPCYLARYNGVVEAPRRILRALGCELVEMPRNGADTFCCGAGGGRIWMDDSLLKERPSENRISEALRLGVGQFVVACPKDVTMFSDAVKTVRAEDRLAVRDITLLVQEAIARLAEPGVDRRDGVMAGHDQQQCRNRTGDEAMTIVNKCNLPEDLYYVVAKHVWARREGDLVTVGMTDVAQNMAKTIVAVTPKARGQISRERPEHRHRGERQVGRPGLRADKRRDRGGQRRSRRLAEPGQLRSLWRRLGRPVAPVRLGKRCRRPRHRAGGHRGLPPVPRCRGDHLRLSRRARETRLGTASAPLGHTTTPSRCQPTAD